MILSSSLSPSALFSWTPRFRKGLRKVLSSTLLSYSINDHHPVDEHPTPSLNLWVRRLCHILFPHWWVNSGVNRVALSPASAVSETSAWNARRCLDLSASFLHFGICPSVTILQGFCYNNSQLINSLRQSNCKFHLCLVPPTMLGAQTWPCNSEKLTNITKAHWAFMYLV